MRLLNNVATIPAAREQFTGRQLADALEDFMAGRPTLEYKGDRCAGIYDVGDAGILAIVVEGHLLTICTLEDAFRTYTRKGENDIHLARQ
jgi:hypothetical protein